MAKLLDMVYDTVSAMHIKQENSLDEIDKLKKIINGGGGGQGDRYKKGILENKVIQNIKSLTGDESQFGQWHQQLINAQSTINGDHSQVIKDIEKAMGVGENWRMS